MTEDKELEQFYYNVIWNDNSPVPPVFDELSSKDKKEISNDKLFKAYKLKVPLWMIKFAFKLQHRDKTLLKSDSAIDRQKGTLAGWLGWKLYRLKLLWKK